MEEEIKFPPKVVVSAAVIVIKSIVLEGLSRP